MDDEIEDMPHEARVTRAKYCIMRAGASMESGRLPATISYLTEALGHVSKIDREGTLARLLGDAKPDPRASGRTPPDPA